jgi:hypothetical protein
MRLLPALLIPAALCAAEPAALTARPIQIVSCDRLASELPFEAKPMGYEPGFQIFYAVTGEDLIGFKDDSLAVDGIKTADGKDLGKSRTGKPTWKMGSFPKVTEDGKTGIFSLECSEVAFGKVESLKISGSVVALIGSDLQNKEIAFTVGKDAEQKLDSLTITFGGKGSAFGAMMGGEQKERIGVKIEGPLAVIAHLEIVDGERRLESRGWSGSDDARDYDFEKPTSATPKLAISYWKVFKEVKVPFGK